MSESKFTPGPWTASRAAKDSNFGGFGAWVSAPCSRICKARGGVRDDRATAEANARLIAAAPDMLEALRDLLSSHAAIYRAGPVCHESNPVVMAARAAIAKATGSAK